MVNIAMYIQKTKKEITLMFMVIGFMILRKV